VVEGNGLENRRAGNGTVGSNPTPSAKLKIILLDQGRAAGAPDSFRAQRGLRGDIPSQKAKPLSLFLGKDGGVDCFGSGIFQYDSCCLYGCAGRSYVINKQYISILDQVPAPDPKGLFQL
jgi:hypothetical protein